MGVPCLPVVPQLRHRPLLAVRNEDRVVAEALAPARLARRSARRACPCRGARSRRARAVRAPRRSGRARSSDAPELAEELRDRRRRLRRVTRGQDAGPAAERGDLEPRVLGEHPAPRRCSRPNSRLDPRVLVVRRAGLRRVVVALERLDRPAGERALELVAPCARSSTRAPPSVASTAPRGRRPPPPRRPRHATAVVPGRSSTSRREPSACPPPASTLERDDSASLPSIASMIGPG